MSARHVLWSIACLCITGCATQSFDPSFLTAAQSQDLSGIDEVDRDSTGSTTRGPTLCCPPSTTVECDGTGNHAELDAWLDSVDVMHECSGLEVEDDFDRLHPDCGASASANVTWTATDACGAAMCAARFAVVDRTPPLIDSPADLDFMCDQSGNQTEMIEWLGHASASDLCGRTQITSERSDMIGNCTTTVVWTATDECGNSSTDTASLTIFGDTTPPALMLNGADTVVLECGVDTYVEQGATATDACDATLTQATIAGDRVDDHEPGTYVVRYGATDFCGFAAEPIERTVIVQDTRPPAIHLRPMITLWPPNHEMVRYHLSDCVELVDACDGNIPLEDIAYIKSIYSDEPENATGDGNTTGDIRLIDTLNFEVRAERRGNSNGRVYGVNFIIEDPTGGVIEDTCRIAVAHDQSGRGAIDDGPQSGFTVVP